MYHHLFTLHLHEAGKYLDEWAFKRLMQEEVRKTQLAERQPRQDQVNLLARRDKSEWRVVWDKFCSFGFDLLS